MTGCVSKRSLSTEHNQQSRVERVERHDSVDTDRLHTRTRDRLQKTDNNTITTNDSAFFQRDSIAKEETNQTTGTLIPGLTRNPNDEPRASIFRGILKWTFWIIIAVTALLIVIRILRH